MRAYTFWSCSPTYEGQWVGLVVSPQGPSVHELDDVYVYRCRILGQWSYWSLWTTIYSAIQILLALIQVQSDLVCGIHFVTAEVSQLHVFMVMTSFMHYLYALFSCCAPDFTQNPLDTPQLNLWVLVCFRCLSHLCNFCSADIWEIIQMMWFHYQDLSTSIIGLQWWKQVMTISQLHKG